MEEYTTLSFQRSGARQLSNLVASGAMSSSLLVLSTPLEEKYPKLPDSQQVSLEREIMANFLPLHATQLASNSGVVGHMFSSASRFTTDVHFSSAPHERHSTNAPFISQSLSDGISLPLTHSSHSGVFQSRPMSHYPRENNDISYNSGIMPSDDNTKQSDWQEWADQLNRDDDPLTPNWNDLLADTNVADTELEQPQVHQ
uniref:Uncharacterized protein n=1 Tax=Nelumbo nucifera TaxID=4432 RepID=A0A822ZLW8_NELNU|nr:TPA_asm: hypothetical protein HUJ06_003983 [Nelumbo nucifera]